MKIIFAGSTRLGIPSLEKLIKKHDLLAVITQPNRPAGRKRELSPTPTKIWAGQNNIPVLQPQKISDIKDQLTNLAPDLMLVASYGQIIPAEILNIPNYQSVNIHPSLLPKYRGPSPFATALLNGDTSTGTTIMLMDAKMDHGPIIAQKNVIIDPQDNFVTLLKKLSLESAELLMDTLPAWFDAKITPVSQDDSKATYTKLFTIADGKINWTDDAKKITNKIRALNPEPGTWTALNDSNQSVKILDAEAVADTAIDLPGKILRKDNKMQIKCGIGSLWVKTIQPAGKKPMTGIDFINGLKKFETKLFI